MFIHLDRLLFSLVPPPQTRGAGFLPAPWLPHALRCLEASLGLNLTPGSACPPPRDLCHS